jgi:hypothetical protein
LSDEHNLVGRDIVSYMQRSEFEPRFHHLFISRDEFLATKLLDQKKVISKYSNTVSRNRTKPSMALMFELICVESAQVSTGINTNRAAHCSQLIHFDLNTRDRWIYYSHFLSWTAHWSRSISNYNAKISLAFWRVSNSTFYLQQFPDCFCWATN